MATLYIAEYSGLAPVQGPQSWPSRNTDAQIADLPPLVEQTVSITGSSLQSAPFSAKTTMVRVSCDADCFFSAGNNPSASGANTPLWAKGSEYFGVSPGMKIAVIQNSN